MERKALYAGSFDPLTLGHVDMIQRAARMFDHVYVAVAINTSKKSLFTGQEKLDLAKAALDQLSNVTVLELKSGLTVDFAQELGAQVLIRGLRNTKDFEYETSIAMMNKLQNADVETLFLLSDERYRFVSSSLIKEVAQFGGDISSLVPDVVAQAIAEKLAKKNN